MTPSGPKAFSELSVGDEVLTIEGVMKLDMIIIFPEEPTYRVGPNTWVTAEQDIRFGDDQLTTRPHLTEESKTVPVYDGHVRGMWIKTIDDIWIRDQKKT